MKNAEGLVYLASSRDCLSNLASKINVKSKIKDGGLNRSQNQFIIPVTSNDKVLKDIDNLRVSAKNLAAVSTL